MAQGGCSKSRNDRSQRYVEVGSGTLLALFAHASLGSKNGVMNTEAAPTASPSD